MGAAVSAPLDEVFAPYPEVLTVEQVAELLGRSARDTYRRLEARTLPIGRKEGGRWLIYKVELRAYVESLPQE
jgi:excisionase family DNA binding protein